MYVPAVVLLRPQFRALLADAGALTLAPTARFGFLCCCVTALIGTTSVRTQSALLCRKCLLYDCRLHGGVSPVPRVRALSLSLIHVEQSHSDD